MRTLDEILADKDRIQAAETLCAEIAHAIADHCGREYSVAALEANYRGEKTVVKWKCYVDKRSWTPGFDTLKQLAEHVHPWSDEAKFERIKALEAEAARLKAELNLNP